MSSSWKASFQRGVLNFKIEKYLEALACFDEAISLGCDSSTVYDSRAAVHEKLGNNKTALIDAKKALDAAPDRWQGYARSARLFYALHKYQAALKMIDLALERIKPDDAKRHHELNTLKSQTTDALKAADQRRRTRITKSAYHIGKLPVEIFAEIFSIVVAADHAQILKLSHVCKHWHGIAVETPSLWKTLVVSKNRPTKKIRLWVQRARAHISVLSFHHDIPEIDWPFILSELILLSWCSLRSLAVFGHLFSQIYDLLHRSSKTETISHLEHLDVSGLDLNKISSGFEDSHLKSLKIVGLTHSMNKLWSWVHRLNTISIDSAGLVDILPALEANPSLENLILGNLIPLRSNIDNCVQLPNLRSIKLNSIPTLVSEITCFFVTTNLEVLHLFSIGLSQDVLLNFAPTNPVSALKELRIGSCTTSVSSLKTILAAAPLLETLQISRVHGVVNDVLHYISDTHENYQDVCNFLKHVDLSNCGDLLTGSAYSLVKTRLRTDPLIIGDASQPGCRAEIESLRLDGCPRIEAEMLPWFRGKVKVFSCVYMSKKDGKRRS